MFYHPALLGRRGPLGTVWIAGHSTQQKLTKRKVMRADLIVICEDLGKHIKTFALPIRASLILGAAVIHLRKSAYLLHDVLEMKKKLRNCALTGRPAPINMKIIPADKAYRNITLQPAKIHFGFDLNMDLFLEDEPLSDDHFKRNMAREEDITMRGAHVILPREAKDPNEPPVVDFGPLDDTDINMTVIQQHEFPAIDFPHVADVVVGHPGLDMDVEQEVAPGPTRVPRPATPVLDGKKRRRRKRRGLIVDEVKQISKEEMKAQLANRKIGTKPLVFAEDAAKAIRLKNAEKYIYTTGDPGMSKILQDARLTAYETAVAYFQEQAAFTDPEDPFGWCDDDLEIPQARIPPRDRSLALEDRNEEFFVEPPREVLAPVQEDFQDVSIAQGDVTVQNVGDPFYRPSVREAPLKVNQLDQAAEDTVDPPPKKVRRVRELDINDRAKRFAEAGDYMNTRFDKFAKKKEPVTFQRIMDGNSRMKTARCFSVLLGALKDGRVTVQQDEPYGQIVIRKTSANSQL